jgi:hypothetical protein
MGEIKYIVTADDTTGNILKVELLGSAGELTPLDLSQIGVQAGAQQMGTPTVVVNIFAPGGQLQKGRDVYFPIVPPGVRPPPPPQASWLKPSRPAEDVSKKL